MRKVRNIRRKDDAVSPVIATILMVAITVVLAAVLYVMVMGMTTTGTKITTPLGLNQQSKTSSSVNILISSAPDGATTQNASISYTHGGTPAGVTATLYNAAGSVVANYSGGSWFTPTGTPLTTPATLTSGMTLVVTPTSGSVSSGDVITISSSQNTFGTSTVHVS